MFNRVTRWPAAIAVTAAALAVVAPVQAQTQPSHPLPPAKFRPAEMKGRTHLKVIRTQLSARDCQALNRIRAGAAPDCIGVVYQRGSNHLSLPRGSGLSAGGNAPSAHAAAASSYWYWSWSDQECSIYGCWFASLSSWEDGVANGANVWNWNHGCTPGGYNTSITWCGLFYNGGGWPHYGIQYGMNGNGCLFSSYGCFNHGLRRWINDWGNPAGYYDW